MASVYRDDMKYFNRWCLLLTMAFQGYVFSGHELKGWFLLVQGDCVLET